MLVGERKAAKNAANKAEITAQSAGLHLLVHEA